MVYKLCMRVNKEYSVNIDVESEISCFVFSLRSSLAINLQ
jgi:hypothetical protein